MGVDATSRTTQIVLDLPGFVVLAAGEYGGELELLVETTTTVVHCHQCSRRAQVHDRREHLLRDVPVAGRAAVLVWWKRIWREPDRQGAGRGLRLIEALSRHWGVEDHQGGKRVFVQLAPPPTGSASG